MGKKGGGTQTVTNAVDPQTAGYQQEIQNRARQASQQPYNPYNGPTAAGVPIDPNTRNGVRGINGVATEYGNLYQQNLGLGNGLNTYGQTGNVGAQAVGGDAGAQARFFNPYQHQVLDQVQGQYGRLNDQAQMGINDQATRAGAFGGSRQGVASGVASGQIANDLGNQMAQLTYQGFNDAQARAMGAANLGLGANQQQMQALQQAGQAANGQLGAAGAQLGAGDYIRQQQQAQAADQENRFNQQRDWGLRNLGVLQSGLMGPSGTTQTQPKQGGGLFGGLLGGALTLGGALIPGLGAAKAIGGAVGGGAQGGGGSQTAGYFGNTPGTSYYG